MMSPITGYRIVESAPQRHRPVPLLGGKALEFRDLVLTAPSGRAYICPADTT